MIGSELLGNTSGVGELAVVFLDEANGKGLDPAGRELRHRRDDGARVDASAQKGSDRHVADLMEPHRLDEQLAQLLHELVLAGVLIRLEFDVPVPFDPHSLVRR